MNQSVVSLVIRNTLLSPVLLLNIAGNIAVNAQVIPDQTLGSEGSIVKPVNPVREQIEGGAIRGGNLFHSFQEFNVRNGASVHFANPPGVNNILSRVTGREPSNILGTLGVQGNANLFFINPNGILFGPNARLDLGGSFFASTANSIRLGENGAFSAIQPHNNALLRVNPSALFVNQLQAQQSIIHQSTAEGVGLQVQPGQTLGLIGGNIVIDGGILTAEQGRIELGSVGENSLVKLNSTTESFTLDYSEVGNFQEIQLLNNALIDVSGEGGGSLQIQGDQIRLSDHSIIQSNTLGHEPGGTLTINAARLGLQEGSKIQTATFGKGSGADVNINASQIEAAGTSADLTSMSSISSNVAVGASGKGGDLTIHTEHLTLTEGAQLSANVFGSGQGGNVTIDAHVIEAIGLGEAQSTDRQTEQAFQLLGGQAPSGISALVAPGGTGNGGQMTINTQNLIVRDGATVGTGTIGAGDSGNLDIQAHNIEVSGTATTGFPHSSLFTSVITPLATGNGGDFNIEAQQITLQDGGRIQSGTSGIGNSGNMVVRANEIELIGGSADGFFASSILTSVEDISMLIPGAIGSGNGGNLYVESDRITLTDGGEITASTFGSGNAGNLLVNAREIEASGALRQNQIVIPTGLRVDVLPTSTGNGGNLTVNTERLVLRDGGQLSTNMFSSSNTAQSGNLTVNATEIEATGVSFNSPSGIVTNVQGGAGGSAGTLTVNTERLMLQDGAEISSVVVGSGQGGNLEINATEIEAVGTGRGEATNPIEEQLLLFLGGAFPSGVLTTVLPGATGDGGNLTVNGERITIKDGAQLGSGTFAAGNSGDLKIQANEINLSGVAETGFPPSTISTSVFGDDTTGTGGNARVEAERLTLEGGAIITASSTGVGAAGSLEINTESLQLNQGIITAETNTGIEGNITLNTQQLRLENQSTITTNAMNEATGGNININAQVAIASDQSRISANAVQGQGGNIQVNGEAFLIDKSSQITATSAFGIDGRVELNYLLNPSQTHIRLSDQIINVETLINQDLCQPTDNQIAAGSSLVITGRGGLPPNPTQPLTVLQGLIEWEPPISTEENDNRWQSDGTVIIRYPVNTYRSVRLAQGWIRTAEGQVILTEIAPTVTAQGVQYHPQCQPLRGSQKSLRSQKSF